MSGKESSAGCDGRAFEAEKYTDRSSSTPALIELQSRSRLHHCARSTRNERDFHVELVAPLNGDGVSTCQAEAIPPDRLDAMVDAAIRAEFNMEAYRLTLLKQPTDIGELRAMLHGLWGAE